MASHKNNKKASQQPTATDYIVKRVRNNQSVKACRYNKAKKKESLQEDLEFWMDHVEKLIRIFNERRQAQCDAEEEAAQTLCVSVMEARSLVQEYMHLPTHEAVEGTLNSLRAGVFTLK